MITHGANDFIGGFRWAIKLENFKLIRLMVVKMVDDLCSKEINQHYYDDILLLEKLSNFLSFTDICKSRKLSLHFRFCQTIERKYRLNMLKRLNIKLCENLFPVLHRLV